MEFSEGTLGGREAVVVQCGMGKVNAGICAQLLIANFAVTHVINTGAAGSLNAALNIGDIVVSVDASQHDFDVAAIGFRKGEIPYTGKVFFEADSELRQRAMQAIHEALPEITAVEGFVPAINSSALRKKRSGSFRNFPETVQRWKALPSLRYVI